MVESPTSHHCHMQKQTTIDRRLQDYRQNPISEDQEFRGPAKRSELIETNYGRYLHPSRFILPSLTSHGSAMPDEKTSSPLVQPVKLSKPHARN
jgi:hypothetical protein